MTSKQNTAKIDEWKREKLDRIVIQPRKERKLPERLQKAVDTGKAASRQEYIINAVEGALERDGVPGGGEVRGDE